MIFPRFNLFRSILEDLYKAIDQTYPVPTLLSSLLTSEKFFKEVERALSFPAPLPTSLTPRSLKVPG